MLKMLGYAAMLACFGVCIASEARAQPQLFGYMIDAANTIKSIEYAHSVVTADDNARIARVACDALTRLANDPALPDVANVVLLQKIRSNRADAAALLRNFEEFNQTFLPFEGQLMREMGLTYPATVDELQIASRARSGTTLEGMTGAQIILTISKAQNQVCEFAKSAVGEREAAKAKWTWGGALLISVDLAGAAAIVSGTLGGGMPAAGTLLLVSTGLGSTAAFAGISGNIP